MASPDAQASDPKPSSNVAVPGGTGVFISASMMNLDDVGSRRGARRRSSRASLDGRPPSSRRASMDVYVDGRPPSSRRASLDMFSVRSSAGSFTALGGSAVSMQQLAAAPSLGSASMCSSMFASRAASGALVDSAAAAPQGGGSLSSLLSDDVVLADVVLATPASPLQGSFQQLQIHQQQQQLQLGLQEQQSHELQLAQLYHQLGLLQEQQQAASAHDQLLAGAAGLAGLSLAPVSEAAAGGLALGAATAPFAAPVQFGCPQPAGPLPALDGAPAAGADAESARLRALESSIESQLHYLLQLREEVAAASSAAAALPPPLAPTVATTAALGFASDPTLLSSLNASASFSFQPLVSQQQLVPAGSAGLTLPIEGCCTLL